MTGLSEIREALVRYGADTLSPAELLALVARIDANTARRALAEAGGDPSAVDLPPAASAAVRAALELARRQKLPERHSARHPSAVVAYLHSRFDSHQERFGALYLDTRNLILAHRELYRGTINRAAVEPRAILRAGLKLGAVAIVCYHNHPSGDCAPSAEDLSFTRRLAEAGEVVGVRLLDHLILGNSGRWCSLKARGGW